MEWLYNLLLEPLQYQFMQRALVASVIVGVTCGLVGTFIMLRKMSLIGDALAHAVLPGVIIGFMIAGKSQITLFVGAVASGIVTSLLIGFINRNSKIKEDTSIGVMFTGAFALGILLVSQLKNVHIDLSSYLFGDILGVSNDDLILSSVIGILVLICVILFYKQLLVTSFDPTMAAVMGVSTALVHYFLMSLLSMTIVASLQSVGVILVVAMLITPAATAYLLTDRLHKMLIYSSIIGTVTAIIGLLASYHLNFASGASMVVFATLIFMLTLMFSPSQGIVIKYYRRKKQTLSHLSQDVLKYTFKKCYNDDTGEKISESLSLNKVYNELSADNKKIKNAVNILFNDKDIILNQNDISLTEKGKEKAIKIIRSHRLWESYLVDEKIYEQDKIHDEAEELEHILTDEILDEIDDKLGYPNLDPHGSTIPEKRKVEKK